MPRTEALQRMLDSPAFENRLETIQITAAFVKEARDLTGLSQKDFAAEANLSATTINNLERARLHQAASLETLNQIARAAGKRLRLCLGD